ncbi:uncharacterized protein CANTADRAFT_54533 [Suhomyces tanzawaensis NRRL Y-17324]|uniref:PRP1 splicing factor N-terminal domain-containing protein n=1 Tax=Suhomyces tanzawaensis NRRL Y-17324 TaxID=984487 RepID=A0A1E4SE93_9ASCO|nr:uncharacterized protein CANTADRAFT_54533 [Suhomyces tanzawaensis NRRL Y-17324]ODV77839.1 hypothetical protein CANTADRAFT_54533 [Suhomyces tanzawaensis NRRL Y-17324]
MDKRAFLDQEPPPGYVPGVGRGAVGFTTSANTAISRVQPGFLINQGDDEDDGIEIGGKFNEEDGLLTRASKDKEDEEADRIYDEVERRLKTKNKRNNEIVTLEDSSIVEGNFADLKRGLATITDDQWENLPEVGDLTRRNKRTRLLEQQQQRFYAVPDSVIAGSSANNTPTDFQSISEARDKVLSTQLDGLIGTVHETVDLVETEPEQTDQQFADIKKGRLILSSLRKTEPNKPNSWIASARLEEQAKNNKLAKNLIVEGCKKCPRNEDIWLENIRIHLKTNDGLKISKIIVTESLNFNPKSEKLWLKAFELENSSDIMSRRKILMKGLENIPTSVRLWRELINFETENEDVKKLLTKAVELCPGEWEFWLLLINLSDYSESKSILNKARKALKGNFNVWLTACKLEEGESDNIEDQKLIKMVDKSFKEMYGNSLNVQEWLTSAGENKILRSDWINEASKAEAEGYLKTCKAIVTNILSNDERIDLPEKFLYWFKDAHLLTKNTHVATAKFIYQYLIQKYPNNVENWIELFDALKLSDDLNQLFEFYEQAIALNPKEEILTLMCSKDYWKLKNDIESARSTLKQGLERLPFNEQLWMASIKLEVKTFNYNNAERLSLESINKIPKSNARIWYKYIHLLRFLRPSESQKLLELSEQALELFPNSYKLYLQRSQILLQDNDIDKARETLDTGIKLCPPSPELWVSMAHIDEVYLKVLIKARSTLDRALLAIPDSEEIWNTKICLERRNNDLITARQLTNKALKILPSSSLIWYQYLSLITKSSQRKNAFLDALKATDNDSFILLSIGKFFWYEGKFSKARSWFERSLARDNQNGDSWTWLYCFLKSYGTKNELEEMLKKFEESSEDINKGRVWCQVAKKIDNFDKTSKDLLQLTETEVLKS